MREDTDANGVIKHIRLNSTVNVMNLLIQQSTIVVIVSGTLQTRIICTGTNVDAVKVRRPPFITQINAVVNGKGLR